MITLRLTEEEIIRLNDLARVVRGNGSWTRLDKLYQKTSEAISKMKQKQESARTIGDYISESQRLANRVHRGIELGGNIRY